MIARMRGIVEDEHNILREKQLRFTHAPVVFPNMGSSSWRAYNVPLRENRISIVAEMSLLYCLLLHLTHVLTTTAKRSFSRRTQLFITAFCNCKRFLIRLFGLFRMRCQDHATASAVGKRCVTVGSQ
jgi:hypothetical protein